MRIIVAGDFCPQERVSKLFEKGDFNSVLAEVREVIAEVDFSIVNLEAPVLENDFSPIDKCGPNLKCSFSAIEAINYAGFNAVTLANNHIYDYGDGGIRDTLDVLENYRIKYVGGGRNIVEASQIFYTEIKGESLAIINCCEHEFSIATDKTGGANPLNPIQQYYSIKEARQRADYVLVIVHGGHEHYQLPSPRMVETYRFFIDAGADAVINHHQHCFSGFEIYKNKPIFYGIGNFCFDERRYRKSIWNEGYMVELELIKGRILFKIFPYIQCDGEALVHLLATNAYDEKIYELNKIISNELMLSSSIQDYYKITQRRISAILNPIQNRFVVAAQNRGWLPSIITKQWLIKLQNYIFCESHRDKLFYFFKDRS